MTETLSRPLAARISQLKAVAEAPKSQIISFGAVQGAIDALEDGKTHYTTRPGIVPLREWVSGYLKKLYQLTIAVDDITITCGIQEAEFVALTKLTEAGSQVLFSDDNTGTVRNYLEGFLPLLEDVTLTDKVDNPQAIRVLYLGAASKNNADWLKIALEHNWWVIWSTKFDTQDAGIWEIEGLAARTVMIGTFERQLPGWAVGWMAGSEMAGQLRAYKQSMTICSPSISQWAAYGLVTADVE